MSVNVLSSETLASAEVSLRLDAEDVVLVSGGAKGITFELALELARWTKTNFALLGSSPLPPPDADPAGDEIRRNLARLREAGSRCFYAQADVTDLAAVRRAVAGVERELGEITAILHGAGVTELRGIRDKPIEEFLRCIRIKARGLYNLLAAVPPARLKALHVISSVLGNSGMRGQVDYAFANAWLDGAVRSFKADHPECHCLSLGYSVWAGTGLGRKIGALDSLRAVGVTPIEIETGVAAYRALLDRPQAGTQFIVTGRLTTDLEANLFHSPPADRGRFLEKVLRWIPGVEVIAEATLSHATDLYLPEHVFEGTPMFPGVMAIEAMVQAAMACAGCEELPVVRNIMFRRPLIVPEEGTVVVRTLAFAEEPDERESGAICVRVAMRSAGDDFQESHFEARCWFGLPAPKPEELPRCPPLPEPLTLDPEQLCPEPLFQGKFFRRITAVRKREMVCESIADVECPEREAYYGDGRSQGTVTPSPAARDTFLQVGAIAVPPGCLPVSMAELRWIGPVRGRLNCKAIFVPTVGADYSTDITVFDQSGAMVEKMTGIMLRASDGGARNKVLRRTEYSSLAQVSPELGRLGSPGSIALAVVEHSEIRNGGEVPELSRMDREQIAAETSEARRLSALANLVAARRAAMGFARGGHEEPSPTDFTLVHRADGKPELRGRNTIAEHIVRGIDVSLADCGGFSLALTALPPAGIDIEVVERRDCETWRALLGADGYTLALRVHRETGEPFDEAATRVWTLLEAGKKAHALRRLLPRFDRALQGSWLRFISPENDGAFVSILAQHPAGPAVKFALAVTFSGKPPAALPEPADGPDPDPIIYGFKLGHGPQGQPAGVWRFSVTFKEAANLSRTVYFSHYFGWVGRLREMMCHSIYEELKKHFSTGKWGMITNSAEISIMGEAKPGDVITGRFWLERLSGQSTTEFVHEWFRDKERIAMGRMSTSWVAVRAHGVVEIQPLPPFAQDFIDRMRPGTPAEGESRSLSEAQALLGAEVYREPPGPVRPEALLHEQVFETTLEDANFVGNIYYSNYYVWQGRVRDRFFNGLSTVSKGELRCTFCRVEHMGEAMPFDRIQVRMYGSRVHEKGIRLYFDYFKLEADGGRVKIAFGEHEAAWHEAVAAAVWPKSRLPVEIRKAIVAGASRS